MSTFNGLVPEFPDVRIDFFRRHLEAKPPLACFLSHVHSDHLSGLESLRSPFVYCSPATREILLQLERYPCRVNYAKGILEARKQTYKHLSRVLKPIPLSTPTTIELCPGNEIQVTLLDANHCPGSVMFLIEGHGNVILYTGDLRCEPWHINSLAREPTILEYTSGIKRLDRIYLDTSFISDVPFQTKSEGITQLLRSVAKYPKDTVFHLHAWTFGYEEVWLALSKALNSKIHVDSYKLNIYRSLVKSAKTSTGSLESFLTPQAAALAGYQCGNAWHEGCLTSDTNVRLHSCEKGNMCEIAKNTKVVNIMPIVARLPEGDIREHGVGGGGDDLERVAELEFLSPGDMQALKAVLSTQTQDDDPSLAEQSLLQHEKVSAQINLGLTVADLSDELSAKLEVIAKVLQRRKTAKKGEICIDSELPRTVRFPYARHSPYPELCQLLELFQPKDIWPCTDSPATWLKEGISISSLFGQYCPDTTTFAYDTFLAHVAAQYMPKRSDQDDSQCSTSQGHSERITKGDSQSSLISEAHEPSIQLHHPEEAVSLSRSTDAILLREMNSHTQNNDNSPKMELHNKSRPNLKRKGSGDEISANQNEDNSSQMTLDSVVSDLGEDSSILRRDAYLRMLQNTQDQGWGTIPLISTNDNYRDLDEEL